MYIMGPNDVKMIYEMGKEFKILSSHFDCYFLCLWTFGKIKKFVEENKL